MSDNESAVDDSPSHIILDIDFLIGKTACSV
jgi:hypothetical protein